MPVPRHRAARAFAAAALVALLASRADPGTPALLAPDAVPDAASGDERPACGALPRVASAAALPNDNREPAGNVHDGVLSLRLEAREVAWYPEGPDGCAVPVHAFAEEDRPARIPGPLIRVRAGTEVRATLRNTLPAPIRVRGLQDRDIDTLTPVVIEPGASRDFRFTATRPGTFYYWATRRAAGMFPSDEDGQLVGALVVDPPDAEDDDRIFILTRWQPTRGEGEPQFERTPSTDSPGRIPSGCRSWPAGPCAGA